ncbi:head-tail adaptor protein [Brevundimonas naejangsanensis]|uniref:head-tail adaptor protein n=1 Tax=Brevundimonas naejangsanensis TaxID=588932 RepID=UPI0026EBD515|nr:head-tail adaptor protein [Brevundimonas naejangsanensis]
MPRNRQLRERWAFQQRGGSAGRAEWDAGFTRWTEVTWLRGSEAVMQDRLTGVQPVILTVKEDGETRSITAGFRAVDLRNGANAANVTGVSPAKKRGFLDILATIGIAQG